MLFSTRLSRLLMMASVLLLVTLTLCTGFMESCIILKKIIKSFHLTTHFDVKQFSNLLTIEVLPFLTSLSPSASGKPPPTLSTRLVPCFSPWLVELGKREMMAMPLLELELEAGAEPMLLAGLGGSAGGRLPGIGGGGTGGIP